MPKLTVEISDKHRPIFFFFGDNELLENLIEKYSSDFKIAYISDKDLSHTTENNYYRIKKDSSSLLKNLEEKIEYATIFLDDSDRKYIPHIFEKLEKDKTKTAVIINIRDVDKFFDIILEYKHSETIRFVFLGDIYAPKRPFINSELSQFINKSLSIKQAQVPTDDKPIYPIYLSDALEGIGQVIFRPTRKEKYFYLFYEHPQTLISAVHILRRVEHDLEIRYKNTPVEEKLRSNIESEIKAKIITTPLYLDTYLAGFEKSIHNFENIELEVPKTKKEIIPVPNVVIPKKSHYVKTSLYVILAVIIFIGVNLLFAGISAFQLKSSIEAFKNDDYSKVSSSIKSAKMFHEIIRPTAIIAAHLLSIAGIKEVEANYQSARTALDLLGIASEDLESIRSIQTGIDRNTMEKLISDATYLYFRFQEVNSTLPNQSVSTLITPDLAKMASLIHTFPYLLGYENEKNYLILFQNNGELRPTGGFIGSVGELKLNGGKIEELKIQDVYEYDGKLKAHVEPHYIVRRYLQPHLYLRDSNFNPDYQKSASMAALIYNLETQKKVDGVISIDFEVVKRIIKEVGPIKLSSYNKTINENNAFEFLQTTIDDSFFPGSTAKRDVLQALFNQLILKLNEKNASIKIARIIPKLMNEKHIMFAFNANSVQSGFTANGYGGELTDTRKTSSDSINDYLAINEANIGVDKANIYVTRSSQYTASLTNGTIESTLTHTIQNSGVDKDYTAYVRIFTPLGSALSSIKIDGITQKVVDAVTDAKIYEANNFNPPDGLEVDKTIESDTQSFGFITKVRKGKTQIIEIKYKNGVNPVSTQIVRYSLLNIKQPGTLAYPFKLTLEYDDSYAPKEVENASLGRNSINIEREIFGNSEFEIQLIKR